MLPELERMQGELRALADLEDQIRHHPEAVLLVWGYRQSLMVEIDEYMRSLDQGDFT